MLYYYCPVRPQTFIIIILLYFVIFTVKRPKPVWNPRHNTQAPRILGEVSPSRTLDLLALPPPTIGAGLSKYIINNNNSNNIVLYITTLTEYNGV